MKREEEMIKNRETLKKMGFKVSSLTHKVNCVAVLHNPDGSAEVRDTKNPMSDSLKFTKKEWVAFIGGVKLGEFDS
jgi:hypothetical protein